MVDSGDTDDEEDGMNLFDGIRNGLVITGIAVLAVVLALVGCGCDGGDTTNTENNETTIIEAGTNEVAEIVVTQDGAGNYVQIDMVTGTMTPVDVTQIGSNNVVVIDVSAPVIPVVPVGAGGAVE